MPPIPEPAIGGENGTAPAPVPEAAAGGAAWAGGPGATARPLDAGAAEPPRGSPESPLGPARPASPPEAAGPATPVLPMPPVSAPPRPPRPVPLVPPRPPPPRPPRPPPTSRVCNADPPGCESNDDP